MDSNRWVEFEVQPAAIGLGVFVRLGDFGDRWTASVRCGAASSNGLGANPRAALLAALVPLGPRASTIVMADPVMFGASADLLARTAV
jgi:hypothetical protein